MTPQRSLSEYVCLFSFSIINHAFNAGSINFLYIYKTHYRALYTTSRERFIIYHYYSRHSVYIYIYIRECSVPRAYIIEKEKRNPFHRGRYKKRFAVITRLNNFSPTLRRRINFLLTHSRKACE